MCGNLASVLMLLLCSALVIDIESSNMFTHQRLQKMRVSDKTHKL